VPHFATDAIAALQSYAWPGNVRELRNAIERAVVLTPDGTIGVDALPESVRARPPRQPDHVEAPARVELDGHVPSQLMQIERAAVVAALEACGGNQTQAARRLGMSRRSLIYKMERFGLKAPPKGR